MQGPVPQQIQVAGTLSSTNLEVQSSLTNAVVLIVSWYLPQCSVL